MVKAKKKGTRAERELLHEFWKNGWACSRTAGSGNTSLPAPDLLAGNGQNSFVFECKTFKKNHKYIEFEEILQLQTFAEKFGAQPFIALRFSRQPWYFLRISDLNKTKKAWGVSLSLARQKGLSLEEFLSQNQKVLKE